MHMPLHKSVVIHSFKSVIKKLALILQCVRGSSYVFLFRSRKFSKGMQRDRGRPGPEGMSKRSLSESKKSKELDNIAKFHICMCIQLCSKGLYRAAV